MGSAEDQIRRLVHSPLSPSATRQAARDRYPLRQADAAESQWFQANPGVAGYAASPIPGTRREVVLNPSAPPEWSEAVHANEGFRHYMYESGQQPEFLVYPHQTPPGYEADMPANRQTIVARILSGDQSLAPYTAAQRAAAQQVAKSLSERK